MSSKALPLTASCLSPLPGFKILAGVCEKAASDLGLGGGFHRVLWFTPLLTLTMAEKVMKNRIPIVGKDLLPYLPTLMEKLLTSLQTTQSQLIKSLTISAIGATGRYMYLLLGIGTGN